MDEYKKVTEATSFIKSRTDMVPQVGIVLGTGLSGLTDKFENKVVIPYEEIPHFPLSTVESHSGNLVVGNIKDKTVVAMEGRFHLYEGYTAQQIAFPIRVMKHLGIKALFESNASGGLNPMFSNGDLVIISDQINLTGHSPLVGVNDERFGARFPDMSEPYDAGIINTAEKIALEEKIPLKKGVLLGLLGPNLETKAEYRFLKLIGADMVCMSTVIEVIAGIHLGLKIFGVSVITDMCLPDALKPVTLNEIISIANKVEPELTKLFLRIIMDYRF
jgi:purine-nucleoside phosphorylase